MISQTRPRIEGREKVTGRAHFVDDLKAEQLGFSFDVAVVVTSTIGRGRIVTFDTTAALAVSGVRLVMTHRNAPKLKKIHSISMAETAERLRLQDDQVRYHGECVAVIVATSLIAAREAAALVKVEYEPASHIAVRLADGENRLTPVKRAGMAPGHIARGDAAKQFDDAEVKIDQTYETAPCHHNAIEPSSVIARWDPDGGVTVHAAAQWHHIDSLAIGQAFGLGLNDRYFGFLRRKVLGHAFEGKVRLTNHLAGGAFGRNNTPVHLFLACMAAKLAATAVKLTLTTKDTFSLLSYRAEVRQRLRLGASKDGRLHALIVEPDVGVGTAGAYVEPVGSWTCQIYAQQSHVLQHRIARLDLNGTGWMRAPGGAPAMFALESAMDELAHAVGLDPLELRLRNHADVDAESGKRWTNKALKACYTEGAAAIGWHDRPKGGTLSADGRRVGYGMATSYEECIRFPASVSIALERNGQAVIRATISEMGQGSWTGLHRVAVEALGLLPKDIRLETNRTGLASGAGAIASTGVYSNGKSLAEAAVVVQSALFAFAVRDPVSPLHRCDPATLRVLDGMVRGPGDVTETVAALMSRHPRGLIEKTSTTGRDFGRSKTKKASFGAVFAKVTVDAITGHVRVERLVGAFDCGRILEPTLARSQLISGLTWGLGHALFEASHVDRRTGRWTNANLAEALIATHADVPAIEVVTVKDPEAPDDLLYLKGVSEVGVIGPAPAIANAIFDATGQRVRSLPLKIDGRIPSAAFAARSQTT
jgi:xanthine dehydrogenase YagR molybdenum-binding subunit